MLSHYQAQTELELSSQDQGRPPPCFPDSITPITEPYVPAIIRKVPETMTNTLHITMRIHCRDFSFLPLLQLSYSQKQPYGWNAWRVPSRAPTRETRLPNTGMALAMMYANKAVPKMRLSHVAQWVKVFAVRCFEPRRIRTKAYLPVTCELTC